MSNQYFRFKKFTIHQDRCAMKVSTDACILGAWTPVETGVKRILDIGTGTGLLALMLAQKSPTAAIDALELDKDAAEQAEDNARSSPWNDRVHILQGDATDYPYDHMYDLIISNPPFFNNSLLGSQSTRNMARHTLSLGYDGLFEVIKNRLAEGGMAYVLLPTQTFSKWEEILFRNNWHISRKLMIHPTVNMPANRIVTVCQPQKGLETEEERLYIRGTDGHYTVEFMRLLEPYYLDK